LIRKEPEYFSQNTLDSSENEHTVRVLK